MYTDVTKGSGATDRQQRLFKNFGLGMYTVENRLKKKKKIVILVR